MLGAKILAFGRRPELPSGDNFSHVTGYYTKETLPSLLKECEYIVSVLPSTNETNCLLENDILRHCAGNKAVIINSK